MLTNKWSYEPNICLELLIALNARLGLGFRDRLGIDQGTSIDYT